MEEHLNIEAVRQDEESWKGSGLCKCLYMCWCVLSIAMCCVICMTSSDNTSEDHVIVDFANTSSGKVEFSCCQSLAWFCLILRIRIGSAQMSHGAGHGCRVWPQLQHDEEIHSRCDFAGRLAKSVGPQSVLLAIYASHHSSKQDGTQVALIHISCVYNLHEGVRKRGGKAKVKAPGLLI